ncbi:hypothetical protein [Persicitalea jodogahamensis]|uniref:DUF2490 domain-containing protein n=1 Tax=Persicitalea jodogahamensis TaxID=402147 RepID=A0A8J3G9S6_9BACT|nr:hypothetical protein [Persicitalea jodogahamensis]GHB75553.1 hypothetical protein GCM10007390_31630 [Persicitalea jodogahamensis]
MRYLFIFSILLRLTVTNTLAQSLRVGYYGETVTHYGLKIAAEWSLKNRVRERNQARKELLAGPALAVYRHPQNHIGLVFFPELAYRRTSRRGGIFELGLAPASSYYFLEGTTYTPDESGDLRRVRWAGQNAFLPTVFVRVGKDLSMQRQARLAWFSRLNVMQQRPYNTSALMRFSLETGVAFPLKKP